MWCGKKGLSVEKPQTIELKGDIFSVCCNECKEKYEKAMVRKKDTQKKYLFLLISSFLIFFGICIVSGIYGLLFLSEAIGLIIIYYPNTTPETVKVLGLEKSRKVARILGIIIMILGIIFFSAISLLPYKI